MDRQPPTSPPAVRAAEPPPYRPWLHRFAMLYVLTTFALIVLGGTVTSKGVGLAVPDWPTTYDYNMFLFPPSMWKGGIFWEHTHRLLGSVVGILSIGIAAALWSTQRKDRPWLAGLGLGVLLLCIAQGIMGGLRVTEMSITLAILHGITAQLFLCLTVLIAAATSRWWTQGAHPWGASQFQSQDFDAKAALPALKRAQAAAGVLLAVLLVQLVLGAAMRHLGAGLAIEDFPTAFGGVIPPFDAEALRARRLELAGDDFDRWAVDHTPAQVAVHFAHRVWALAVLAAAIFAAVRTAPPARLRRGVKGPMTAVGLLVAGQVALGAWVVLSGRHPEVATAHQAMGAALLATAALLVYRLDRLARGRRRTQPVVTTEPRPLGRTAIEGTAL